MKTISFLLSASLFFGTVNSYAAIQTQNAPNWKCENEKAVIYIVQRDTGLKVFAERKGSAKESNLFQGNLEKKDILSSVSRSYNVPLESAVRVSSDSISGKKIGVLDISKRSFTIKNSKSDKIEFSTYGLECTYSNK